MDMNLKRLSTPQLHAIRQIIVNGPVATSEKEEQEEIAQLCHESPPKGYPSDKSQYGDPACYRYPLNTKSRCLAAWRYVHQAGNKKILGGKWGKVVSKIKSYAKKNYNLELEAGASDDVFDWEQAFIEFYDGETMGERCELVELETEVNIMTEENATPKEEVVAEEVGKEEVVETPKEEAPKEEEKAAESKPEEKPSEEKTEDASAIGDLTEEFQTLKEEVKVLREYKELNELARAVEELRTVRKAKIEEAGLSIDVESDEQWIKMSNETFDFTINQMKELKNVSTASQGVKVPPITGDNGSGENTREIVREGLAERKRNR